jgi:hypothetical protein
MKNHFSGLSRGNRVPPFFLFALFFLTAFPLFGQEYTTTGNSPDWTDPLAWTCQGGGCNQNPTPGNNIRSRVTVKHDITYNANSNITVRNRGVLIVSGATLTNNSNLEVSSGGTFIADKAEVLIGPGILNNNGVIELTNSLVTKDGNVINNGEITLVNSCFSLVSGNFNNNKLLEGVGGVKVLSGNASNSGSWSPDILYFLANNGSGLPGSPSTQEEVDAVCQCALVNCDIEYAYDFEFKTEGKLSPALLSLANTYLENPGVDSFIYTIDTNTTADLTDDLVLVDIVVTIGLFDSQFLPFLASLGIPSGNLLSVYDPSAQERIATLYVPIAQLLQFNMEPSLNRVYEPARLTNKIISQGDFAQGSLAGRLGWNLTGAGSGIAVISDSFNNKGAAANDIANEDLPGPGNEDGYLSPVIVLNELPAGGSDEGRAMLQIVHDVAPGAQLYFQTGFISEYNMAAGIIQAAAEPGVDIIVDDLTYLKEPYYEDGVIAQAIEAVVGSGKQYFSAAGNFGDRSYESDFTPVVTADGVRHRFDDDFLQTLPDLQPGLYVIGLQWDDNYYSLGQGGATVDLDIYLTDAEGN